MTLTRVVKNTVTFPEEFWADLLKLSQGDDVYLECLNEAESVNDVKEYAFCDDHYEHMGSWLNDERVAPLLEKYQLNGEIILSFEGTLDGWWLVDGKIVNGEVSVSFVPKSELENE